MTACTDLTIRNQWHAVAALDETDREVVHDAILLEEDISFAVPSNGDPLAWRRSGDLRPGAVFNRNAPLEMIPALQAFGYIWICIGTPEGVIFEIPEYDEPDRRNLNAATVGVNVSAPRAIENFLDMGHFPFVHTGILGAEPHTEVREYTVEVNRHPDELVATRCQFYQPAAAVSSSGGAMVEYVYRVPHPHCSILYKSSGADPSRMDVIALFVQPVGQERIRAHMLLSILDSDNSDTVIRQFQQSIFAQDRPILENQLPKRLPLDPRAETPIRADHTSVAYRRWLSEKGITYGVIPSGR